MSEEKRLFQKHQPVITEVMVVRAARDWDEGNEILSLATRSAGIDSIILLLATDAELRGPFLLTPLCARELCARLLAAGFGP